VVWTDVMIPYTPQYICIVHTHFSVLSF
jgi:hypothetical protein